MGPLCLTTRRDSALADRVHDDRCRLRPRPLARRRGALAMACAAGRLADRRRTVERVTCGGWILLGRRLGHPGRLDHCPLRIDARGAPAYHAGAAADSPDRNRAVDYPVVWVDRVVQILSDRVG